ncbi:MAG: Ribosomal protein S11 [Candidatus Nomurabacteria bacterium GW2011_GWE1_32_28]|uniref:Small ribosomal subunit protein uS11 n=1 Tax=Candidatus Nomurabacteria bacterium GW2011_GWF1_31_48 TaxID=1618767 RepID=A0A0F9YH00_9BACT|nr:MAG: Ribosomal protein S11 [Candidatus Nomurabacteria bacterium GW2011_GWF2_30_133]KKP28925.1 MAG: Ribosomal protein S11 [Candidatus Nomurabacteria bacterium GW2011_GWE2_31_40]KKP30663.1 MAG: Ribosomal protein S11 [Candidatus Nomurabacteria bacterium GW2011_GWF1_31_48]KKP35181.1 MAG: Ribosomal protein S11 [Candidatus Nomurabacteria bacterium GW2011_GWE1_32_28]HAS80491.1 30S ribosomal protein S11 [Candidatus Nomurabacteria bacterium]
MGKTKTTIKPTDEALKETKVEAKTSTIKTPKKKITSGILFIDATFNNTKVLFGDKLGNTLFWSSAGSLGFRGAKKGTPFAASKVGDLIGEKAANLGVKDSGVVVRGVGSGREPVIRSFMAHGIEITFIKDATPVPHNGPKPKKPRRV